MNGLRPVNPASLGAPRGYSHGMLAPAGGRLLAIAGQVAWDADKNLVGDDFASQFGRALANVVAVVREVGEEPGHLAQLTIFVTDHEEYMACACDVRMAADDARIAFLFTKVGLSGADMGATWLLPRIVGLGRAAEILMTGDFVSPEKALEMGLYNRVVPKGEVVAEATSWAEKLARGPSFGLEVTKKMLYREAAMDVEAAMASEVEIQAACMEDPNFRESYEAFVAKRKPKFI